MDMAREMVVNIIRVIILNPKWSWWGALSVKDI